MAWNNPSTWLSGAVLTAAQLNAQLRDNMKAIGDSWPSYAASWTALTTNPVLGNGTLTSRYREAGKTVDFFIGLTMGSTTTYGNGAWLFSLPATPFSSLRWPAEVVAFDTSLGQQFSGPATWVSSLSRLAPNTGTSPAASVLNTAPFTWATGDTLVITGSYERA